MKTEIWMKIMKVSITEKLLDELVADIEERQANLNQKAAVAKVSLIQRILTDFSDMYECWIDEPNLKVQLPNGHLSVRELFGKNEWTAVHLNSDNVTINKYSGKTSEDLSDIIDGIIH